MTRLGWMVGGAFGWLGVVMLGAVAFVAFMLAGAARGPSLSLIVALVAGIGASVAAILLARRVIDRLDPDDPVAGALAELPRGAVIRRGRTFQVDWTLVAAGALVFCAAVAGIAGSAGNVAWGIAVLFGGSLLSGAILGAAGAADPIRATVTRALGLPAGLIGLVAIVLAILSAEPDETMGDVLQICLTMAVVTLPPILVGVAMARQLRQGAAGGRDLSLPRPSRGLEQAMTDARTSAIVWEYPYGPDGEARLQTDRTILGRAGFAVTYEERRAPPSTSVADLALIVSGSGPSGDQRGRIRVVYRRTDSQPSLLDRHQRSSRYDR